MDTISLDQLTRALDRVAKIYITTNSGQGAAFAEFCRILAQQLQEGTTSVPDAKPVIEAHEVWNENTKMPFGKHKGKPLKDIEPDYLIWLHSQPCRIESLQSWLTENMDKIKNNAFHKTKDEHVIQRINAIKTSGVVIESAEPADPDDVPF